MSPPGDSDAWNYGDVQSVGGGFVVDDLTMRFYFGAMSRSASHPTSTGTGTLRRDGFASLKPTRHKSQRMSQDSDAGDHRIHNDPSKTMTRRANSTDGIDSARVRGKGVSVDVATVTTQPLVWRLGPPANLTRLFVNIAVGAIGSVSVEVLPLKGGDHAIDPYTRENCVIDGVPSRWSQFLDTTKGDVTWTGATTGLAPLALSHPEGVRFRFVLEGTDTRLFSFWVSNSSRGYSRGFVAAGGPPYQGSADKYYDV